MRVAYTLEQCWHPVPGGTAVAALELARALVARGDLELVGVAARHREDPPDPWRPPIPVTHLPLPRLALYESWHRLRRPSVERATGTVDVIHVVAAQDCGLAINPDCVRAQLEGNILQTLSRALHEEIRYDRDRVTTVDWASYPILTFPEVPKLELEVIQRLDQPPLGAGEAASTPVGAALANAVFDATGVRLRTIPFRPERVKAALAAQRGATRG